MRYLRGFLIAGTLIAVVASPVFFWGGASPDTASVYAAVANKNSNDSNHNGNQNRNNNSNNNSNNNNNNNSNSNGNGNSNGNDNVECFPNLNSNDNVPCDFNVNGNGNDNGTGFPSGGSQVGNSRTGTTKCFDVQEVGLVQRSLDNGDVTVAVPPDAGFSAVTRLTLHALNPSSVPAPTGGTLVGGLVFTIDAQAGCDGPAIVSLPGGVNLGITYRVSADKSKLQIVMLSGGTWTNVTTVPDSVNPYVSASLTNAGTYALVQKP
jgi:hypothetical protein